MKINRIFLCAILSGFLQAAVLAAPATNFSAGAKSASPIEPAPKTLQAGEKLVFDVFWLGIPVGFGSLEVKEKTSVDGVEAYHLVAVARANDFLYKIYPLEDEIHSYMAADGSRSLRFEKTLREGRYVADEKMVYDYRSNKCHYESLRNRSKKEINIPGPVQDFLSSFFWFRLQDVRVGDEVHTLVNAEEKNWDLAVKVLRRETREFKDGRAIDTIVVEPKSRFRGALYDRGRAWVHFSVDRQRVPVWVRITTPFGPVIGVLKSRTVN